jgi:hypothetical protein
VSIAGQRIEGSKKVSSDLNKALRRGFVVLTSLESVLGL